MMLGIRSNDARGQRKMINNATKRHVTLEAWGRSNGPRAGQRHTLICAEPAYFVPWKLGVRLSRTVWGHGIMRKSGSDAMH